MGACISSSNIHQISKPKPNQPMDYAAAAAAAAAASKPTNFVIAASPIGEKPSSIVTRPMPEDLAAKYRLSSAKFRSFGSNEDVFFESQPWLESDGDDEFFSVNGDKTPSVTSSASNTPIHKSLSAAPSRPSEDIAAGTGYKLTLSPVKRRKSLSELFKEDEDENQENSNHDASSSDEDTVTPKSTTSKSHFPQHTFTNSSADVKVKKDRPQKPAHHCFPRHFSVHSPNMAKKNSIVAA